MVIGFGVALFSLTNIFQKSISLSNIVQNMNKTETRSPESLNFNEICRTCLNKSEIIPIFDSKIEDFEIVNLLEYSVLIQARENDLLPKNICTMCAGELYKIFIFKKKCEESESYLKLISEDNNHKSETEKNETNSTEIDELLNSNLLENCEDTASNYSDDAEIICKKRRTRVRVRKKSRRIHFFKCRECSGKFHTKNELQEHRREMKHTEMRNYSCQFCDKTFTSSKLRQHLRSHTKEKPYRCQVCSQAFSMSGNLKRHVMTHTGERPHVCETCGKGFIQATSLQAHQKTHIILEKDSIGKSFIYTCNFCGRGFKRASSFNAHLKKHANSNESSQDTSKSKPPINEEETKQHTCNTCNKSYKTKHLLKAHQLTHGEKSFLCSDCGKGFITKAALHSHLKVHTGEKPHTCLICKKSFAHVGSFDSHMLIHTGQRPYSCIFCPKSFTQLSHLNYHLRTHSGEKPYSCSYCGKSFALKGNLTVHVRTHTGETPYLCTVCGKGFYDSSSLKKHKKNHKVDNIQMNVVTQQIPVLHHPVISQINV